MTIGVACALAVPVDTGWCVQVALLIAVFFFPIVTHVDLTYRVFIVSAASSRRTFVVVEECARACVTFVRKARNMRWMYMLFL